MKNKHFLTPIALGIISFVVTLLILLKFGISYDDKTHKSKFFTYKIVENKYAPNKDSISEGVIKFDTIFVDTVYFNNNLALEYFNKNKEKINLKASNIFFNQNPKFLLWIFLMVSLFSISLSLIYGLWNKIKLESKIVKLKDIYILLSISISVSLSTYLLYLNVPNMFLPKAIMEEFGILLKNPTFTIIALSIPTLILGIICMLGVLIQGVKIDSINITKENKKKAIDQFMNIKNSLNEYLGILGIVVTSGIIITTSVYQRTFNDYLISHNNFELFPKDFIYLFGLLFSFAIIIIYVPIYSRLIKKGNELISEISPINIQDIGKWNIEKESYSKLFGVKINNVEGVYTSLKVFAPLLTSIVTSNLSL